MPLESSPESPLPVRTVARALGDWIGRLGRIWVEGQVTQLTRRPGQGRCFLVLRDPAAEMSLNVSAPRALVEQLQPPLAEGARIVVWGQPEFWAVRGSLTFAAHDIRPVGVGALLARLEQLRTTLAAEGLFAPERKRPLPFLPRTVGLVTGRASAAERDVVENATRRWPAVAFRVEPVAVQGPYAVTEVIGALRRLDADPDVDVIVIARGGGSMEDLLPFSDESLVRAVAAAFTPIVTAIGHESDTPIVDHVADRRASTPTDAAKLVVPDVAEEAARIRGLADRARRCVEALVTTELHRLDALRTRPALADPRGAIGTWSAEIAVGRERGRRAMTQLLDLAAAELAAMRSQVTALSPQATLDRGYAVLQRGDGTALRDAADAAAGERLRARLARGRLTVVAEAAE
ncbi:MAG TPA: exodeoxyribonuclease VII large subunit [Mycobacteriales bacterium]|nr:exodeoxyribonuclease VII large subunit [Mycobacteriales bacterium]